MSDQSVHFPQKWAKKLPQGWTEAAESMQTEELKKVIFECEGNLYTIERAKDSDASLQKAREEAKQAGSIYKEAKDTQSAKIKFALFVLEGRGIDLDKSEK